MDSKEYSDVPKVLEDWLRTTTYYNIAFDILHKDTPQVTPAVKLANVLSVLQHYIDKNTSLRAQVRDQEKEIDRLKISIKYGALTNH